LEDHELTIVSGGVPKVNFGGGISWSILTDGTVILRMPGYPPGIYPDP